MFRMLSLLLFLLKSHEVLLGKSGVGLKALVSLLTALWRDQLRWLGTLSEFNGVVLMSKEEPSKFSEYGYWMNLKEVWRQVKNFSGHMNGISDNDDLRNVVMIWGLVDTTPHGEKFSFCAGDVDYMMDVLGNRVIMGVYMWYWYSNVILDVSICDYNGSRRGTWCLDDHVVKLMSMSSIVLLFTM